MYNLKLRTNFIINYIFYSLCRVLFVTVGTFHLLSTDEKSVLIGILPTNGKLQYFLVQMIGLFFK